MDTNNKLIQNIVNDTKRLNSQLRDLEEFKADYDEEEYNNIKKDTLNQLLENTKIIDNMTKGNLSTNTELEDLKKRLAETINENYNVKELLKTYLSKEVYYLRENIKTLNNKLSIHKISNEDYQVQVSQLLLAIGQTTELNDEEKALRDKLKQNVILNNYSKDDGLNKESLENKINLK